MPVKTTHKKKRIVTSGSHVVNTPEGRKRVLVSQKDIEEIATTGNGMLQAGLRIPAPWKHDLSAVPIEVVDDNFEGIKTPYENAGFWEGFQIRDSEEFPGEKELWGMIESPGSDEDPKSPAYAVGNLVKDTSIYLKPNFMDGKGRKWGPKSLAHIAVCHDAIETNQPTFETVDPDEFKLEDVAELNVQIAMSQHIVGGTAPDDVSALMDLLSKVGVSLPEDTSSENIWDRLKTALNAVVKGSGSSSGNSLEKPQEGTEYLAMPLLMAALTPEQVKSLAGSGAINPVTKKAWTEADFAGTEVPSKDDYDQLKNVSVLMGHQLMDSTKEQYKKRIAAVTKTGILTPEQATQKMVPLLDQIAMSGGKMSCPALDSVLEIYEDIAEAKAAAATDTAPSNGQPTPAGTPSASAPPEWLMNGAAPTGTETHNNPLDVPDEAENVPQEGDADLVKHLLGLAS